MPKVVEFNSLQEVSDFLKSHRRGIPEQFVLGGALYRAQPETVLGRSFVIGRGRERVPAAVLMYRPVGGGKLPIRVILRVNNKAIRVMDVDTVAN